MVDERLWQSFRSDCVEALERFDNNEIKMDGAGVYLDKYRETAIDAEMLQFIWNIISLIDADHEGYLEVLDLLRAGGSEKDLRAYMDRPLPPFWPEWIRKLVGKD